jgi:hypothetical protein
VLHVDALRRIVAQPRTLVRWQEPCHVQPARHEPPGPVSVVGDFNAWEPGRHELVRCRNGTRTVSIILPPGEHRFRYLASDGVWLDDETADKVDPEGLRLSASP